MALAGDQVGEDLLVEQLERLRRDVFGEVWGEQLDEVEEEDPQQLLEQAIVIGHALLSGGRTGRARRSGWSVARRLAG